MKDVILNTKFKKFLYYFSWVFFIFFGLIILWIVAGVLNMKDYDKETKKGILNKTYQKLIFYYGTIMGGIFTIMLIIDLIQMIFTGHSM